MNATLAGGLSAALAVALGAFGAHGLKSRHKHLEADKAAYYQDVWKTASNYHLVHSAAIAFTPALVKTAAAAGMSSGSWSTRAFALGITLFSGSLYSLVLTEDKRFGAIAPIGGTSLIAGWVFLALRM